MLAKLHQTDEGQRQRGRKQVENGRPDMPSMSALRRNEELGQRLRRLPAIWPSNRGGVC